jgi:NAD(P)-dependent dehydrogenase (short-subunit alcohol dehydrogenase family)
MAKMGDLSGRVAIVTGAGPNIGQQIARTLARHGAAVGCNDLDSERLDELVADIKRNGGQAVAVPGDVTDPITVDGMIERTQSAFGVVDLLVNNAFFLSRVGGLLTVELKDWYRSIDVILSGTFLCSRGVAQRLVAAAKPGVIVNIASTSGHRARPNALPYCSAKGGILNMTRAMALELAPHSIRVCSVSPTRTGSGPLMGGFVHANADGIPMGRIGEPDDIADAVAFIASDSARFITGEDLRVDGGTLATFGYSTDASAAARA